VHPGAPVVPVSPGFFLTCTSAGIKIAITPTSQAICVPDVSAEMRSMPVDNQRIPPELKVPVGEVKLEEDLYARSLR
jgi:hypothetical protein